MVKFKNENEMLNLITEGTDLYNIETGDYVFVYNEARSIAVYNLSEDAAKQLAKQASEIGESWSGLLGPGGRIYDSESYERYNPNLSSNLDYCLVNYNTGTWIRTSDFK